MIIPAIDLMGKKVVRLTQGKKKEFKVYSENPLEVALNWKEQGAELLHLVDLDAVWKEGSNLEVISELVEKVKIRLEVGGGIRSYEYAQKLLNLGVERIVLGTRAIEDRDFLENLLSRFKERVCLSLDLEETKVALQGWQEKKELNLENFIENLKYKGLEWIIYTDVLRDGTLKGVDIRKVYWILNLTRGMNLIVSGGVGSLEDIKKLKQIHTLYGVIVGKALYEGVFTLKEALLC